MHKTFCSLSILVSFAMTACIIEDTSDDDGASASNSASNSNTNSNSNSDSGTSGNETSAASETTAATSDATTAAPADSSGGSGTGGTGMCGWGPLKGQMNVTDGYSCTGEAEEDPRNVFPRDCPAEVTLEVGGECGGDMGVTGVGCCDGTTNWYCADDGSGPVLYSDPC